MSKNKNSWFNWHCPYCRKRNRTPLAFQFEIPQSYVAIWECDECGEKSEISFALYVNEAWREKKPPSLKKRKRAIKRKRKERVAVEADGTKKDRGYRNDHKRAG